MGSGFCGGRIRTELLTRVTSYMKRKFFSDAAVLYVRRKPFSDATALYMKMKLSFDKDKDTREKLNFL